jgi:carotenoid cleavage dioxygenase-like enzyme
MVRFSLHFTDNEATGLYRYVQTNGYQEEVAANKLLYGNYGMTAPGQSGINGSNQSRTQPILQCWRYQINY